jgi:DNA-binding PadR family transcriptional regulator
MALTTLPALLLFLAEGQSGYDLRVLFQSTPIGLFSDSPGVVYPALARLERQGLLRGEAQPSARKRRVYRRTGEGEAALGAWLRAPIDPQIVARRPQEIELRYVLIAIRLGAADARPFLAEAGRAYEMRIAELEAFRDANRAMGPVSIDALDLGVDLFRTRLEWCRITLQKWERER